MPLFLFTYESLVIIFYSKHVESKDITMKLLKINLLSGMQPIVKHTNFASPCNINNFDGMENGGGWLGSFEGQKSVRTFHVCYKNPISVLYDYLWPPLACSFPNRVCYWLSKRKIKQLNNACPSAWNNRSYRIREQIQIQVRKRYRTTQS